MVNEPADAYQFREQLLEAVRQAVAEREDVLELARMRAAFGKCQGELQVVQDQLASMTQAMDAWQSSARLRAEKIEAMDKRMAELVKEIAHLRKELEADCE